MFLTDSNTFLQNENREGNKESLLKSTFQIKKIRRKKLQTKNGTGDENFLTAADGTIIGC